MLRTILTTVFIAALLALMFTEKGKTPEEILETVVIVESSSGVVVYSDEDKSLILTAYHVIERALEKEPAEDIEVMFLYDLNGAVVLEKYKVEDLIYDAPTDLALLEIHPNRVLYSANIADTEDDPSIGDDIFLASNPNFRYRSLKKGIISSKTRYRDSILTWEVSAGIVFGSSGGGAFTTSGKLFGIVRSVEPLKLNCWNEEDEDGKVQEFCQFTPIYHMGYISTPQEIRSFILDGKYSEYFNYLR